jgi:hypothetical protein
MSRLGNSEIGGSRGPTETTRQIRGSPQNIVNNHWGRFIIICKVTKMLPIPSPEQPSTLAQGYQVSKDFDGK